MIHNISRFIAALALLATAQGAWAQTPSGNWDTWVSENNIDWSSAEAKAAAIPQSDDGSTVYISTAEQLAYYAYAVNNDKQISGSASGFYCGRTVELIADIDLSAHYWKPIGINNQFYFNGYFHGNGHVITGMHVNGDPQSDNAQQNFPGYGLFGYLHTRSGGTSTITDLVLKDFSVTASYSRNRSDEFYLGGLVGRCDDNTAITNCLLVNGSVSKVLNNNYALIGKVAGGGSPSTATANYYHNVSVSGWDSDDDHYAQQTIGGETEARAVALTISGTHGNVAFGGTVGRISGGIIYAPANETVTLNTTTDAGYIASLAATGLTLTSGQFTMPDNDDGTITATFTPDPAHFSQSGDTYTIKSSTGWNVFCDLLADNTKGYFDGKTVKLDASITVSRMAGGDSHDFTGTFDGQGHTLTFTATAADNYCAPFRNVKGGSDEDHAITISNLNVKTNITANDYRHAAGLIALQQGHVNVTGCNADVTISSSKGTNNPYDLYPAALVSQAGSGGTLTVSGCTATGTISTDGKYAAGLVGIVQGTATITDCLSSVTINSSTAGDGTHGGIVAVVTGSGTITGCVFNGKLLSKNTGNDATGNCAGFVAWGNGTISNCLYAPAAIEGDEAEVVAGTGDYPSGTFYRGTAPTVTNCYYTRTLGTAQGKATRTVAAAADVTIGAVALTGTATQYTVSGITAYSGGGLQRGETLYYGSDDLLSLTLSNSATGAPQGYQYTYTASAGTLSGTTLTMPDQDVTITAALAPIDWATVNQGTSKEDPYMIYNKDQLLLLAHRVNGTNGETANTYQRRYFKLGADITFSHDANEGDDYAENYEAIGGYIDGTYRYFYGNFDGDGHTVSGIRIRKTGTHYADIYQGLFGLIGSDADIRNVHLTDARITGFQNVGGIAGYTSGGDIKRCSVTDSYITATGKSYYGTICGSTTYTLLLRNNYYHGCTVNGTAVTSGKGCDGSDIAANNGALPAYHLALGANITTPPGTFAGQTEWLDTPPVDARLAPGNGFTLAGNHYFASGYEFTPGSTLASGAAQGYTPRATLGGQLLDLYTPTGDDDLLAGTAIARLTITADCDGKTLAAALRSTGEPVTVAYIKADGTAGEASAIALDGTEPDLSSYSVETWYFVGLPTVAFGHMLNISGDVHLILADGCTMNVTSSDANGIYVDGSLTIYGQTDGTGTLNATSVYNVGIFTDSGTITISGGRVTATGGTGIITDSGNITISGGRVTATGGTGIITNSGNITISGGRVTATSDNGFGILTHSGTITLGCTTASDFIYVSSYSVDSEGTQNIADDQELFDEDGNSYSGTINDYDYLNGKTLRLSSGIALTARQAPDGNYWTTYYNSTRGFTIDADENACAYTATYGDGKLTLNKLGKEIPAGTAVIIVAENNVVSMTATDLPPYSGSTNDLRGVDVDTDVDDITSTLGTGTFYVLGMTTVGGEQHFGFHRYTGEEMAAHKAYVFVASSPSQAARSLTMVFDEATGISDATRLNNKEEIKNNNWFTLDGRRLQAKPTAPGIYINNGKKVVIK